MLRRSPTNRLAAVAVAIALGAALGACGDDNDSGEGGSTDGNAPAAERETPAEAFASGQELCRIIGGSETFELNYGVSRPVAQATLFAEEIYVGNYPRRAAAGCLKTLRAEAPSESG